MKSYQEFQSIKSLRILPRKIKKRLVGHLSPQRDLKVQEIHSVQIAKMSKWLRGSKIQIAKRFKLPKVLNVKNPRAPPRDPKVQEIHAVQVTKRSSRALLEVELFLAVAFLVL